MLKTLNPHRRLRHRHSMDSGLRRNDTVGVEGIKAVRITARSCHLSSSPVHGGGEPPKAVEGAAPHAYPGSHPSWP